MIFLLLPLALAVYIKPVFGFLVFLFSSSGTRGFVESILQPLNTGGMTNTDINIGLYLVILFLFFKNSPFSNSLRKGLSFINLLLWAFTITMGASIVFSLSTFELNEAIASLLICLIWAPLFVVFLKLSPTQRAQCRKLIILFSALTAFLNLAIIITKNNFLNDILSFARWDESGVLLNADIYERPLIPSVYSLLPFGFWFCLEDLVTSKFSSSFMRLVYSISILLMFSLFLLTFTRTVILGILFGSILVTVLFLFIPGQQKNKRPVILIILFFCIIFAATLVFFPDISNIWTTRLTSIKYTWEDPSLQGRVEINKYLISGLENNFTLLGYRGENLPFRGDPHTILFICWRYGLVVGGAFVLLLLAVFLRLLKVLKSGRQYNKESSQRVMFMLGCYVQFQFMMISGSYLPSTVVFPLVFLISEVERISSARFDEEYSVLKST